MNLYRTARSFIGRNFIRPIEDFCAAHCLEAYEFIFYHLRHTTHIEDCGEAILLQMDGFNDCVRLKRDKDFALKVPLDFFVPPTNFKVAAVVHVFYTELAAELKNFLSNIPCSVDVFISTTDKFKRDDIAKIFDGFDKGTVTIKIFENRGRDIAAAFVGFREIYKDYDVCVHLHSKKSPHAENRLAGWRDQLYSNLLGSPEIVGSILNILADERIGMVFPQYFAPIRISVNWGNNYLATKNFLHRFGMDIDERFLLEFPAGSMFWFKPKALAPLIDSGLTFDDFPVERGQVDGTLAHAIERTFLFIVEAAGYGWVKVDGGGNGLTPILKSSSQSELTANIERASHSVLKNYRRR